MKHWGAKAPGIVAKMMTTLKADLLLEAFGMKLGAPSIADNSRFLGGGDVWRLILKAKFEQNEVALRRLRATAPHTLVEQARFPRESNYWNAYVVPGSSKLIGKNMMGRMLQQVRDHELL